MSMKVERSTLEQVRARFDKNKRKREEEEKNKVSIPLSQLSLFFYNYLFATKMLYINILQFNSSIQKVQMINTL